ncbi:hypothetical protein V6N12_062318 [Hibiscus sabdariffa]|uniref:Uncharacterized protein n=1 Tax=Hibiscus sabdariffa TaxID=183260 RepID=A0ABR2F8H7_9ROSI
MQGAEGLAATAWLALRFVRAACWVGYLAIVGMIAGATDAPGPCGLCSWPHASLCATTGPLASLSVAALVEGFASFRPITVVAATAGRLAWLPSFFFAWCTRMPMPMLRSLCFRPTLVLAADFVSSVHLVVGPVQWPAFSSVVAAIRVDWSKEQPSRPGLADGSVLGLLAAAEGPPAFDLRFVRPWCVRPLCAGCFLGLHLVLWLLDGCVRGIALMARPLWWHCFRTPPVACFAARMPLERIDFSARPHEGLLSCFTSYLHWANFSNPCFGLG